MIQTHTHTLENTQRDGKLPGQARAKLKSVPFVPHTLTHMLSDVFVCVCVLAELANLNRLKGAIIVCRGRKLLSKLRVAGRFVFSQAICSSSSGSRDEPVQSASQFGAGLCLFVASRWCCSLQKSD